MKNKNKLKAVLPICVGMGVVFLSFQNFVPHDPMKGKDGSEVYMSYGLVKAIKDSEQDKKAKRPTPSVEEASSKESTSETQQLTQ